MKKIKTNIKDSILLHVTRSRWAGYKSRVEEFYKIPFVDTESINMSILLFDIYLLENLVQAYNDYFVYSVDYESFMEEQSFFSFDYFIDSLEELEYKEENLVSFSYRNLEPYLFPSDFVDSLLFEENDEDFIVQYYYTFFIWGPLEILYHNLTKNTWHSFFLKNIDNFYLYLVLLIFKLNVYFSNFYNFQALFLNRSMFYLILNKWNSNFMYYKVKNFNVQYSLSFESSSKSIFYYFSYFVKFVMNTLFFLFFYNVAFLLNIFRITMYWFTNKILACM